MDSASNDLLKASVWKRQSPDDKLKSKDARARSSRKAEEDIKKLYGLSKLNHETKHLEIMIEMQRQTANIMSKKKSQPKRNSSLD